MKLRNEILELIRQEQQRQDGRFVPNEDIYLEKLAAQAELVCHEVRGVCVGFAFFYCNDAERQASYVTLLAVAPEARRQGVGSALVHYVLGMTKARGFSVCRLEAHKGSPAAMRLYEASGFQVVEDRGDKVLLQAVAG